MVDIVAVDSQLGCRNLAGSFKPLENPSIFILCHFPFHSGEYFFLCHGRLGMGNVYWLGMTEQGQLIRHGPLRKIQLDGIDVAIAGMMQQGVILHR